MGNNKSMFYMILFEKGIYRICIIVLMCFILTLMNDNFFSLNNLMNIARQTAILVILAVGATGTILTHGIDLSLAGIMSLSGCTCGYFLNIGISVPISIIIAIMVGAGFGFVNGFLVAIVRIPSFVSTYGVRYIANGLALMLMGSNIFFGFPSAFQSLGIGFLGPIPILVIIALTVVFVLYIILQRSNFGKQVYCVGSNITAAFYSGIPTVKVLCIVHIISSTCAALAGILQSARMNAAQAGMGDTFQMLAIASIVIGGTSMSGGEGNVVGGIIGALILTLIVNGMNLMNVTSQAQPLVTGTVIVLAVLFDIKLKQIEAKRSDI